MKTFKPKICKRCGREYIPTSNSQKYCGSQILKTGCSCWVQRELTNRYKQTPACKEKDRIRRQLPENKETVRLSHQSPEYREKARIYRQKPESKERARIKAQSPEYKLTSYKYGARMRGLGQTLTDNEFYELFKQPCYYTGRTGEMGVDRVDNSIGYTKENSVPCCKPINMMKGTLSKNEFFQLCKEVVIHNHLL